MKTNTNPAPQSLVPAVGMGATIILWTDRHAATIVATTPTRVTVQRDEAIRLDANGMSDSQDYAYKANPDGARIAFSLRKNGSWVRVGETLRGGQRLAIGVRSHYHDYSF